MGQEGWRGVMVDTKEGGGRGALGETFTPTMEYYANAICQLNTETENTKTFPQADFDAQKLSRRQFRYPTFTGNFPDIPKTFPSVRKVFQSVRKLSVLSRNFPKSINFPWCPETFHSFQKIF